MREQMVRVTSIVCSNCGADTKAAYQASGGEPDGEAWDWPREIVERVTSAVPCPFCDGQQMISCTPARQDAAQDGGADRE